MSTVDSVESVSRYRTLKSRSQAAARVSSRVAVLFVVLASGLFVALGPATQASAASPSLQSTGSSFAGVAIQQWVGEASTLFGLNVNWQVSSSVIGLDDYAENQIDFAASDIPYSSGQALETPTQP